ncbi:MAG: hypothetical protein PHD31_01595, partial [Candidatus Pacebacteria bacterium]|nr:hypothetical protein [Candidatus Paceibacterota bacterium]
MNYKIPSAVLFLLLIIASPVAAFSYTIAGQTITDATTFSGLIIFFYNLAIIIGGAIAFITIIVSGIKIMNSQGNSSALSKAKKTITNSLIGLAVLLGSYLLLTTINPEIINIQDVPSLWEDVTSVVFPTPATPAVDSFTFQEIPIGTVAETVLAGNSSTLNAVPCYKYNHNVESGGKTVLGDTIDLNGDGKIDEKDSVLDKDMFYCMKLLNDAIKKKTEEHLNKLIHELDIEMNKCTCSRCDYRPDKFPIGFECEVVPPPNPLPQSECGYCPTTANTCRCCGSQSDECKNARSTNTFTMYGTLKQYKYDPCPNRLQLKCKSQEIQQLLTGAKPKDYCYDNNLISLPDPETDKTFMSISEGAARLGIFKAYFENQVKDLKTAEKNMKEPLGERITFAEFNKVQDEENQHVVSKSSDKYSNARYCSDFKCETEECLKGVMTTEKRVCEITDSKEHFLFDGDPATFYFNNDYTKETDPTMQLFESDANNKVCSVYEGDIKKEEYSGTIPIGETVDYAEAWGEKVAFTIGKMRSEERR